MALRKNGFRRSASADDTRFRRTACTHFGRAPVVVNTALLPAIQFALARTHWNEPEPTNKKTAAGLSRHGIGHPMGRFPAI
jgi:hypothetical protein